MHGPLYGEYCLSAIISEYLSSENPQESIRCLPNQRSRSAHVKGASFSNGPVYGENPQALWERAHDPAIEASAEPDAALCCGRLQDCDNKDIPCNECASEASRAAWPMFFLNPSGKHVPFIGAEVSD
jgi:hypothetical protein